MGVNAIEQLTKERYNMKCDEGRKAFKTKIDLNCIAQCGDLDMNDYSEEEIKLERETIKILGNGIKLTATTVRIPVIGGIQNRLI